MDEVIGVSGETLNGRRRGVVGRWGWDWLGGIETSGRVSTAAAAAYSLLDPGC